MHDEKVCAGGMGLRCIIENDDFLNPIAIGNGFVEGLHVVKGNGLEAGPHFVPEAYFAAGFGEGGLEEMTGGFLDLINQKG